MRSRLRWASARGLRSGGDGGGFFFGMGSLRKVFATGDSLRLSLNSETVSVLLGGDPDVNSDAILTRSVLTQRSNHACICDGSNGFHWNGIGEATDCGRPPGARPYAERCRRGAVEGSGRGGSSRRPAGPRQSAQRSEGGGCCSEPGVQPRLVEVCAER